MLRQSKWIMLRPKVASALELRCLLVIVDVMGNDWAIVLYHGLVRSKLYWGLSFKISRHH